MDSRFGSVNTKHTICFVCDFFYPNFGGVENHIYYLSRGLQKRGHKVLVITHSYDGYEGLCYISSDRVITQANKLLSEQTGVADSRCHKSEGAISDLPVYYVPKTVVYQQASLPSLYFIYGTVRRILIQEGVQIVHGHQSTSTMAHECMFIARTLGLKTVFTEHSLFGYTDLFSIDHFINKLLKMTLSDVDHVICVSNSCRKNLISRVGKEACPVFNGGQFLSTIPNAIDCNKFIPDVTKKIPASSNINIMIMSRFVYRKGIDMVVQLIPKICSKHENAHFIIAGDGPKRSLIEDMIMKQQLTERVELHGPIPHEEVRNFLIRGHIFLNCSLTESFCMSLVEAAACGLHVVSTNVGGVPEVLPSSMTQLVEPDVGELQDALTGALRMVASTRESAEQQQSHAIKMIERHKEILALYSWDYVTDKTIQVYDQVTLLPNQLLMQRLRKYFTAGFLVGPLACLLAVTLDLFDKHFYS